MSERAGADQVVARVAALSPGTRFVGIDGLGGSGKTTLAERIAAAVPRAAVVHTDDLQGLGIDEWDWVTLHRAVVEPLGAGRAGGYGLRAWGDAHPYGYADVPVGAVVVVEGVSATRREAQVPWDLTVWVDTPQPVRRARTLARDDAATQDIWRARWIPSEQAYAERERPWERVDLIVDGTAP